jgi:molybdopterin-guanine dinucleotide biosynthesis protein A
MFPLEETGTNMMNDNLPNQYANLSAAQFIVANKIKRVSPLQCHYPQPLQPHLKHWLQTNNRAYISKVSVSSSTCGR